MEATLAALGNRIFLMNNVHEDEPVVFQSRWALSYLRGPLTRSQIETVMKAQKVAAEGSTGAEKKGATKAVGAGSARLGGTSSRPLLPPGVEEQFLAATESASSGSRLVYFPALLGRCRLHFVQAPTKTDAWVAKTFLSDLDADSADAVWDNARIIDDEALDLEQGPADGSEFAEAPSSMTQAKSFTAWQKSLKDYAYQNDVLTLWRCPQMKMSSQFGESEAEFRIRLAQGAREIRDAAVEKLRAAYASKVATIQSRIRAAEDRLAREKSQSTRATMDSVVSIGSSILGALFGRKLASRANIGKATTSMRSAGRAAEQRADVGRAEENVQELQKRHDELEAELQSEIAQLEQSYQPEALELEETRIRPRKGDIQVESLTVVWRPHLVDDKGNARPAFELLAA
jgi:hypothetical protein